MSLCKPPCVSIANILVCVVWLVKTQPLTNIGEVQYCYVNGRMMRDKLLNHAIRQAYTEYSGASFQPSYVLYLQLDPRQVDVNVHPSKRMGVRFHEARQVRLYCTGGWSGIADGL